MDGPNFPYKVGGGKHDGADEDEGEGNDEQVEPAGELKREPFLREASLAVIEQVSRGFGKSRSPLPTIALFQCIQDFSAHFRFRCGLRLCVAAQDSGCPQPLSR